MPYEFDNNEGLNLKEEILEFYAFSESELNQIANEDDWKIISQNLFVPWSKSLLLKFRDKINWYHAARNNAIPWDIDLILDFKEELIYTDSPRQALGCYVGCDVDLIVKHKDLLCWFDIIQTHHIKWTVDAYLECEDDLLEALFELLEFAQVKDFMSFAWYFDEKLLEVMKEA